MSTSPGSQSLLLIEKVLLLRSLSIFSDTPEIILAELAPLMQQKEVEQGTLIFEEGEQGDCMYIILSGEIESFWGTVVAGCRNKKCFCYRQNRLPAF